MQTGRATNLSAPSLVPVILAGGTGSRLWPVSRSARPKQFARLAGHDTLLSDTVRRLEDAGCAPPVIVTNDAYRWAVAAEVEALGLEGHRILLEPSARNTAAAIFAAVEVVSKDEPDALILVAPSDHAIKDPLAFADAVARGVRPARDGDIVTFGVTPTEPETGFGYIEAEATRSVSEPAKIARFIEKPDHEAAEVLIASGRVFWNAGVFLASARTLRGAFQLYAQETVAAVRKSVAASHQDLGFLRLGAAYTSAPSVSFDTAIMEKCAGTVVPMSAGWFDIGSWRGVWASSSQDETNCVIAGTARGIDSKDSLIMSADPETEVVGIGLRNIAAVATRDAVLVVDMDHSQSVSTAVQHLESEGVRQAAMFTRDDRPWGHFETLARGARYQVKSIVVVPGGRLSLQSHEHRAEHWIVVEGTATVTKGDVIQNVTENQSVYIPLGTKHRLENRGRQDLRLIEVQTGTYLEEDDIVRYDDEYHRA